MSRPLRYRGGRRSRRIGTMVLAGWLFADLLLVLVLVSMGDQADPLVARPRPSPTASPTKSPTPKPSPSPTGPRSVEKNPLKFKVSGSRDGDLIGQIKKKTDGSAKRNAALVLTFGGSGSGTEYAHRVNRLLNRARSSMFTKDTGTEDFHDLSERSSTAELWVYFYTLPR